MFSAYPALILNADFRPLSYFPLSTWDWEHAIKGVVEETVSVVAEYDVVARSPSTTMRLPSVIALKGYQPAPRPMRLRPTTTWRRPRPSRPWLPGTPSPTTTPLGGSGSCVGV